MNAIAKYFSLGVLLTLLTTSAYALQITDVKDYTNKREREYFISPSENLATSRNVRKGEERWLWQQGRIDTAGFSDGFTAQVSIDAYMSTSETSTEGLNTLYAWSGNQWLLVGDLVGENDSWSSTAFELPDTDWVRNQVRTGMYFYVHIKDPGEGSNTLTLRSSTLLLSDEPVVSEVTEPGTLVLLGLSLTGIGFSRRKREI